MIGKVIRGRKVGGLVRYLFGPGDANEHVEPRVIAGWDSPAALEPELTAHGLRDFRRLVDNLNAPLAAINAPDKCVWHCPLRTAPGDRTLSDAEWSDIAAEVMDRTGLARRGDDGGCRWVAIRHDDNHVHVVATLARQDGRRATTSNDFYRVGEACRAVEEKYGLTVTAGRDRTAAHRATRAETEKAHRLAKPAVGRDLLRTKVQAALAGAAGEADFFARLEGAGVMVGRRHSERNPAEVTGYKVALPEALGGVHTAEGTPVWYGGSRLAADLSLPKLRARWQADSTELPPRAHDEGGVSTQVRLRHEVQRAAGGARSAEEFLARLRATPVQVRERYSELRPDELTGYSVAWPGDRDLQGEPVWRGRGSLAPELSLPRLQARWAGGEVVPEATALARPIAVAGDERQQVWQEARQAVERATQELRGGAGGGHDVAQAAGDLLEVVARAAEPRGDGELHDVSRTYDRARREGYGRVAPRSRAGADLRLATTTLALLSRAGRDDGAALLALTVALAGLVEAVADLRVAQGRDAGAVAAREAAVMLGQAPAPRSTVVTSVVPVNSRTNTAEPSPRTPGRGR